MTVRRLHGNQVLRLDDPRSLWIIDSGSVALFGVELQSGEPTGSRQYYFSRGAGDVLFGLPRPGGGERPGVIAVALEQTVLREMQRDRLAETETRPAAAVGPWIERWRKCVGDAVGADGKTLDSLPGFHEQLLRRLQEVRLEQSRAERTRFEERTRRSGEATAEAVGALTSVLETGIRTLPPGPDLFVAISAVAQSLGVTLRAPAAWESEIQGTDPVELITRASHVRVRKVLLQDDWWRRDCGPLVAFLGEKRRPVALLPTPGNRYRLLDPSTRSHTAVDGAIAASLDPQAYMLYRPLPEQAHRGLEVLKFALKGRARDLVTILATGVAATLLGMFTPQATAILIDKAIPDADRGSLAWVGFGLAAAAFGSAIFRLSQGIAMMRVETSADAAAQSAVWDRLLNLQLSFFRKYSTGDLQNRVSAVSQIREYLGGTTLRTLFGSVIMLLNLLLLTYYSPSLTLIALGVAGITFAVTAVSSAKILRCMRQILELHGEFFGLMVQLINGVAKLRVAAAEERAFARWAHDFAELLKLEVRQRKIHDVVQVYNTAASTFGAIALFALAATLIFQTGDPALTAGIFLAFHVAFGTFIGAVTSLSNTVTDVMAIGILRERAAPILEAEPEINERKADPGRLAGRLDLEHLVFQYQEEGPIILDDVSLRVGAGQFVALVGPSGSGKSTLLRLLLGFETPLSGSIFYDGQDLSGLDVYAVRRQMGVVLQNGQINAGSLFENIVSGTQLSLNDAWEAARATGFADEIEAMPMGMHTVISEGGTNISGGQRQRLLLTRALVHKPSILLLDEATSALDNKTQSIVSESLQRLQVSRVVIAHRLSTIRHADRIYVVESGRIVQEGTFEELSDQEGLFRRLMARQLA